MLGLSTESRVVARVYNFVACIIYALALFFIKRCHSPPMTISFMRGSLNIVFTLIQQYFTKEDYFKGWSSMDWSLTRSVFAMCPTILAIYIVKYIKISVFAILTRLQMIIVFFLGIYFLGTRFDARILLATGVSILGVVLVIAPGVLGLGQSDKDNLNLSFTTEELFGLFLFLFWLLTDSTTIIITSKVMGLVTVSQSVVHMNMIITLVSGIGLLFSPTGLSFNTDDILNYVLIALCYYIGQMLVSESFRVEKNPSILTVIGCNYPISCLLLDVLFIGTRPSTANLLGCAIVTGSSMWAVFLKSQAPVVKVTQVEERR